MNITSPLSPSLPFCRAIVIGCPGSGKSTFARRLRERTGLPLHHLDAIYWRPDRTTIPREEFLARLGEIIASDTWIIDGHYGSTLEWRIAACDTVFLLDLPTEVCLEGVRARRGQLRSDMPWVETQDDEEFLEFIRRFRTESRPRILELLQAYPEKTVFHFTSREECEAYLTRCGESSHILLNRT